VILFGKTIQTAHQANINALPLHYSSDLILVLSCCHQMCFVGDVAGLNGPYERTGFQRISSKQMYMHGWSTKSFLCGFCCKLAIKSK